MKSIIAIDPGKSGGIAFGQIDSTGLTGRAYSCAMPSTSGDILDVLKNRLASDRLEGFDTLAVIELVGGFAGGRGQPGSHMFKFGKGFGVLEGILMALGVRILQVRPQDWQKHFHLGTASACSKKNQWKNKLKAEAQRRFPECKVTLKTADALLILDWARNQEAAK